MSTVNPHNVTGALPAFWSELATALGGLYNETITLQWVLNSSIQGAYESLYHGEIDALCGYNLPTILWMDPRFP